MTPELYLERHARYGQLIPDLPGNLQMIVTIPAYREPDITATLNSLNQCNAPVPTAVLILINYAESDDPAQHQHSFSEVNRWIDANQSDDITFRVLLKPLPTKHAGVGLARKILMDEAVRHIPEIIVCLDADCTVEPNYLEEIWKNHDTAGCAIHFEHPLEGTNLEAIAAYELHLRYYVEAQRWLQVPYAWHTVGSSMSVRTSDYCKTGGMNIRKAGEDFYFLQKIMPRGFRTITTTTVFPSGRLSDRVPFGTGKAVGDYKGCQLTYNPEALAIVKGWLNNCLTHWDQNSVKSPGFIDESDFQNEWQRLARNSTTYEVWERHFFAWFDGFKLMKMLHYLRDNGYPNVPVSEASAWLLNEKGIVPETDLIGLLKQYRELEISYSSNMLSR